MKIAFTRKTKIKFSILFLLVLILINLISLIVYLNDKNLHISFLDVGQGDSIFITTPSKKNILIDAGPNDNTLTKLGEKINNNFLIRKIFDLYDFEIIIATHDDLDHIGGLKSILEKYKVKILLTSIVNSDNENWKNILQTAKEKNIKIINVDKTGEINFADGVIIKILFPTHNISSTEDSNNASIVTQIIFNENKILLTGDLGLSGEIYLNNLYGENLKSDILKLGHHGSETSTHPQFLQNVKPQIAIVSAGKNNQFNHPHRSVIELVEKFGIKILETSKENTISFAGDGINLWRE